MSPLKRPLGAVMFIVFAVSATGCDGCPWDTLVGEQSGARLGLSAKSATPGQEFTADVSRSQIGNGTLCPDVARFHIDDKLVATIDTPPIQRTSSGCRLDDDVTQKLQLPVDVSALSDTVGISVTVQGIAGQGRNQGVTKGAGVADYSVTTKSITVDRSTPAPTPQPVATTPATSGDPRPVFFAMVTPATPNRDIALDARESWDPDGPITAYDWDFNADGVYDSTSTTPFATIGRAQVVVRSRNIVLRVHDGDGRISVSAPLALTTSSATSFTAGQFGMATEVAANTAFDVNTVGNVPGATEVLLNTDDDGLFDDGGAGGPFSPGHVFTASGSPRGGYRRVQVRWTDGVQTTTTTDLIRVTPFENPSGASVDGSAAAKGTPVQATLRATAVMASPGRPSLVPVGLASKGVIVRGRLNGRLLAARKGGKVPASVKVLARARFAGSFDGTLPQLPGGFGIPVGKGVLLARSPSDPQTQLCLRITQRSASATSFSIIGATGRAKGLRASGRFPPLRFDTPGTAARLAFTVKTGRAQGLPRVCRALARSLRK